MPHNHHATNRWVDDTQRQGQFQFTLAYDGRERKDLVNARLLDFLDFVYFMRHRSHPFYYPSSTASGFHQQINSSTHHSYSADARAGSIWVIPTTKRRS